MATLVCEEPLKSNSESFNPKNLPPYLRKSNDAGELVPWLYLKGVEPDQFGRAVSELLGPDAPQVSAAEVRRLEADWRQQHADWGRRPLHGKQYVYVWAGGVRFQVRSEEGRSEEGRSEEGRSEEEDRQSVLVLMGVAVDGKKELIALAEGDRHSEQSWKDLLSDVRARGVRVDPRLAVGDGRLGFWKALVRVYPTTRQQHCWVQKTAEVLQHLPKRLHGEAKRKIQDIWKAATWSDAERALHQFLSTYQTDFPEAAECLANHRGELLSFYEFPAEHWTHLRSAHPIEAALCGVLGRGRPSSSPGGSRPACAIMAFKLIECATRRWRAINGSKLLPEVLSGVKSVDGAEPLQPVEPQAAPTPPPSDVMVPREARHEVLQGRTIKVTIERLGGLPAVSSKGELLNISRGGLKLATSVPMAIHEAMVLTFEIPELGLDLSLPSRICWSQPVDEEGWRIGCSFNPPLPEHVLDKLAAGGYIQRRHDARVPASAQGSVRWEMTEGSIPARLVNVSAGGFCITCERVGRLDGRLLLEIEDEEEGPLTVPGRPQWKQKTDHGYTVGCGFISIEGYKLLQACLHPQPPGSADQRSSSGSFWLWLVVLAALLAMGSALGVLALTGWG